MAGALRRRRSPPETLPLEGTYTDNLTDPILERNPATDGALVIQAADGARPAGKFEVPIKDVSRTFTARHFGTIGTPEFELGVINRTLDELDARAASIPIEVEGWHPAEFDETEEDDSDADEASAWDNVILP